MKNKHTFIYKINFAVMLLPALLFVTISCSKNKNIKNSSPFEYNTETIKNYFNYLNTKANEIYSNSEEDENYLRNYKGNKMSGAKVIFLNNSLFDDSCVLKIGDTRKKAISLFGINRQMHTQEKENKLNYSAFEIYYDKNEIIDSIVMWADSPDDFVTNLCP